jgi:hypothetical protein
VPQVTASNALRWRRGQNESMFLRLGVHREQGTPESWGSIGEHRLRIAILLFVVSIVSTAHTQLGIAISDQQT